MEETRDGKDRRMSNKTNVLYIYTFSYFLFPFVCLFVCFSFFFFFGLSFSPSATFVEAAKSFKDVRVGKAIK